MLVERVWDSRRIGLSIQEPGGLFVHEPNIGCKEYQTPESRDHTNGQRCVVGVCLEIAFVPIITEAEGSERFLYNQLPEITLLS